MPTFKAQKVPTKSIDPEDIIYRFCLIYQQYTYYEASKMPYKRIVKMLKLADKEYAKKMLDLIVAISAPHSKNGVKQLISHYNKLIG